MPAQWRIGTARNRELDARQRANQSTEQRKGAGAGRVCRAAGGETSVEGLSEVDGPVITEGREGPHMPLWGQKSSKPQLVQRRGPKAGMRWMLP